MSPAPCNRALAAHALAILAFAATGVAAEHVSSDSAGCSSAYDLGASELRLRHIPQAVKALNGAIQCDPKMVAARLALGEAYLASGDEAKALRAYTQALEIEPKNPSALRGTASIYLKNDNNEKAIPVLETLTRVAPKDAQNHVNLGAAYAATANREGAKAEFEAALRMEPENPSALTGLGNFFQREGDEAKAIAFSKRAIAAAPSAFEPYFVLGAAYSRQQNYAEARKSLETALKLGGNESSEIYYLLARVYGNLGLKDERDRSLARFAELTQASRASRERQNETYSLLEQSRSLVNSGDLKGAVEILEKAAAQQPADDQILFRLAGLHYDLKEYEQARVAIDAAVGIAPTIWIYHFLRGLIAMDSGQLQDAKSSLQLAARLNPAAPEVQDALRKLAIQDRTRAP